MKKRVIALVLALALAMGLTGGMVFAADDEDVYTEITVGGEYTAVFEVDAEDYDEDEDNGYSETVVLSLTPEESGAYEISSSAENARSLSVSVENSVTYKNYTAVEDVGSVFSVSGSGYGNQESANMWLEAGVEYYIVCSFYAYTSVELTVSVESYDGVVPVSAEYVASEAEHYYTLATSFVSYDDWEYYDEYIYINSLYNITDDLYYDNDVTEDGIYITDYFGIIMFDIEDVIILTYSDGTTEKLYVADEDDPEYFTSEGGEMYWCGAAWSICEELPGTGDILYMTAIIGGNECGFSVTIPCTIINLADVDIDADDVAAGSDDSSSDDDSDGTSSGTDDSGSADDSASSDDSGSSLSVIDSETTASYTLGSGGGAVIAVDGDIETFVSVTVDGTVLTQDTDYTVTEGSTIITFTESFLESLSEGDHDVVIAFEDGDVETTLTIAASGTSSDSDDADDSEDSDVSSAAEVGDSSSLVLWMALGLLAAFGLASAAVLRRKSD